MKNTLRWVLWAGLGWACVPGAHAQTADFYWTTTNGTWNTAANWSNGVPLEGGSASNAIFFDRTSRVFATTNDFTAFQLNLLSFSNAPVTLTGNELTFVANGAAGPQVVQSGASNVVVNTPLALNNTLTFAGAGVGAVILSNSIAGAGGLVQSAASSVLWLSGTNSYSGGTLVGAGALWAATLALGSGPITNNGTLVLTQAPGTNVLANPIGGSGTVTRQGAANMVVLTGDNTYTGLTTIANDINTAGNAPAGGLVLSNTTGGTAIRGNIQMGNGGAIDAILILGASEQIADTSVLSWSATNHFGRFLLHGNTETIGGLNDPTNGQGIVESTEVEAGLGNMATLIVSNTADYVFSGYLRDTRGGGSGKLGFVKDGSGTQILVGSTIGTISGGLTVRGGTLGLSNTTGLAASGVTVNSGRLLLTTAGDTTLRNNGVTVSGETLSISGTGSNNVGTLQAAAGASATWAGPVILADLVNTPRFGGQGSGSSLTVSGPVSDGAGTNLFISVYVGGGSGKVVFSGTNTYSGRTDILRGTLQLGASDTLPAGTTLDVHQSSATSDASTFDLNGYNQTVARFLNSSINASSFVTNSAAGPSIFTVNQAANTTYGGRIGGNLALVKTGVGTLTLGGVNTFFGSTTISNGTLALTSAGAVAASPLLHLATATATADVSAISFHLVNGQELAGIGTLKGGLIMDAGARLSPGDSAGTLNVTGAMTLNTGTTNYFDLVGAGPSDLVEVGGTLDLGGIQFADFAFNPIGLAGTNQTFTLIHSPGAVAGTLGAVTNGLAGSYDAYLSVGGASNNELQLTVIPEPNTVGLVGLFVFAALLRRRLRG